MHATTHSAFSPACDGESAPNVLSGLTVVLPCLDEAENLPDAVARASDAADRYALEHEIIVVDDGSSDDTVEVAAGLAVRDPRVRLVVHSELLVKSRAAGARVAEVPVHHRPRAAGRHAGTGPRLTPRTLRELGALRRLQHDAAAT
jgi:cellulose synthase/poly-beta-1,6-N-acetylglucosamine synthase-like glycosyltransferase